MRASELRRAFVAFFEQRGHTVVPSSGLIPHHPTAPMFTNSGMMQFVPYFLGEEAVPFDPPRAVSVQKCARAGGKHNDLDAIGRSARHLSFFEMLGNFSFGDYFKDAAIPMAWELLCGTLGIDGDRLWITCHDSDDESAAIWRDAVGVPAERIQRLDKDNFWEMGDTGPCGPSSELFYDFGPELGPEGGPANPAAEHRYVEIWNLVFMQHYRRSDGSLTPLAVPMVDTGAGLERIVALLAGSASLYAADVLADLVSEAERVTGHHLGEGELSDVALRLMADHTRTMSFLVADGVIPSNEERGYVLRRIIRRAVRFAYLTGVDRPVLADMVGRCIEVMGEAYPALVAQRDTVLATVTREEGRFRETLRTGSALLDGALDELEPGAPLSGATAFKLHDTFDFPLEVTREFAELRGHEVDLDGFDVEMARQREGSRKAADEGGADRDERLDLYRRLVGEHGPTEFVGRETDHVEATVLGVLGSTVVLDRSPFYAESGGQVGDTGWLRWSDGSGERRADVVDTTYGVAGLVVHRLAEGVDTPSVGTVVDAAIDSSRRAAIARHHTATHILHWALRAELGEHVKQQGSWVGPDRLRFDFSHFEALSATRIAAVEDRANAEILTDATVRHYETSKEDALARGAIAFFGDKYGDTVRVLEAGRHSVELCGGTHVPALGLIGPLKIVAETSIGSNMRRIEAVAGTGPIERLRELQENLDAVAAAVGVPVEDLEAGVGRRLEELKSARVEIALLRRRLAQAEAGELADSAVDGVVVARVEAETRDDVRDLAVSLRDLPGVDIAVLMASPGGKGVAVVAAVDPSRGIDAGSLIAEAVAEVGGGGGRGEHLATAGGRHPERIDAALDIVRAKLAAGAV
ncbi:MAG: alanine--tRNA ligase [Microthrixaceae bacterium]